MSKKIFASRKRNKGEEVIGYTLPVYHDGGAKVYVDFYCFDPGLGEMRRKKYHLDKYSTKKEQKRQAGLLIATLTRRLREGWNPYCDASSSRGYTEFSAVLEKYLEHICATSRKKTVHSYTSRVNILKEYNAVRVPPIKYAYQYDHEFVVDFLDYILLDREAGARTWNNYRGWCGAFGEYMVSRKYIESNPASDIPKMTNEPKKRQPLDKGMLRKLQEHLKESDPNFLLAVMFEYYTFIRPGELSNLRIRDIEIKEQRVFIAAEFSKNKKNGYVGLNAVLIKMMIELGTFKHDNDKYLFGKDFRPSTKKASPDVFNKRWAGVRKTLGWGDEYQFYSLKDSGIRDLANSAGIVIARDQARHSDISTTNKYLGMDKNVREETKTFSGAFGEITPAGGKTPPE